MTPGSSPPPASPPEEGLDHIGWYIATLHHLLGHDKAAVVLGQDPGSREGCLICAHEAAPTAGSRAAVIAAIGTEGGS